MSKLGADRRRPVKSKLAISQQCCCRAPPRQEDFMSLGFSGQTGRYEGYSTTPDASVMQLASYGRYSMAVISCKFTSVIGAPSSGQLNSKAHSA